MLGSTPISSVNASLSRAASPMVHVRKLSARFESGATKAAIELDDADLRIEPRHVEARIAAPAADAERQRLDTRVNSTRPVSAGFRMLARLPF